MVYTKDKADIKQGWIGVRDKADIAFFIRACSDANLALSHIPSNEVVGTYNITLGSSKNTESSIR